MDILSSIYLNPERWPLVAMTFLRIVTLFFFLPFIGDQSIPASLRITLGIAFTFLIYPVVAELMSKLNGVIPITPLNVIIMTVREVFFSFCVGFFAKLIFYATSLGANIIGVNMGFHVVTMFSPTMREQESPFSIMKYWFVLIIIISLNIHHIFIEGIVKSFYLIPIGSFIDSSSLIKAVTLFAQETFLLALKLAAPLIAVQILINISMGLLNRALPSLNVFIISFPISFLVSLCVLLAIVTSFTVLISGFGFEKQVSWFETIQRLFIPK